MPITTQLAATEWRTDDFDFDLPVEHIAQIPLEPRDQARMLCVTSNGFADKHVYDLTEILRPTDVLVMNDTKVIPARLFGKRGEMKVEILLHQRLGEKIWSAFAKPGKRLRSGDMIVFAADFVATVGEKYPNGQIELIFKAEDHQIMDLLKQYGEPPLPPYIKRDAGAAKLESERYQTVYAAAEGAVAAPTAGLHFTTALLDRLRQRGHPIATVTLHVGAGTFQPVKADLVKDHIMHAEWGQITEDVAQRLNQYRREGRRIVAVGTTSLRLLESAADEAGVISPFSRATDIFITPGYRFRAVDALMTNFHLPKSTLFMLVSAFAGMKRMREAYEHALRQNYRFYSYGDATFLEKQ